MFQTKHPLHLSGNSPPDHQRPEPIRSRRQKTSAAYPSGYCPPDDQRPARSWLRVQAAADYLSLGVSTLNKLRTYGGGPRYAKLGHTVVYDPADLDAWADQRKVRSTSERARTA